MRAVTFWLRWSWRDLRARWVQVAAIALIIAVGSGFYSGLSSTSAWRRSSYGASYAVTHMFDLRVSLSTGSFVPAGELTGAVLGIPHARLVTGAEPRLLGSTQVDVPVGAREVIVPATVVGLDVSAGHPTVSALATLTGRTLQPGDAGQPVAVLNRQFGDFNQLAPSGSVTVSGGHRIAYVGQGLTPEYFVVVGPDGQLETSGGYAVLFTSLETAQALLGHPGQANDLVLTLAPGADVAVVRAEIARAMAAAFPQVGYTITDPSQDYGHHQLYTAVKTTQRLYTTFAALLLAGAAFGAFNLTVRVVEAQRREIGVAMALGTPPTRIAVRPLLLGLEVAVLGAVLGVGVGLAVDALFGSVLRRYLPLPVWHTAFQPGVFLRGATLGVVLPFVAIAYPVWRAVRVAPVEAIRTAPVAAQGLGRSSVLARLRLPGNTIVQMPVRNVLRSTRRTLLTALGIAATITVLVALMGLVDSIYATIASGLRQVNRGDPGRSIVNLDRFRPVGDPAVQGIATSPAVSASSTEIQVGGTVRNAQASFPVVLTLLDFQHAIWTPEITKGVAISAGPGLVLCTKAAHDLHVGLGGTVVLHHPRREGLAAATFVDTPLPVVGISPLPTRYLVFLDASHADLLNLTGLTNVMMVNPTPGESVDTMQRSLYQLPGVASVQSPTSTIDTARKELNEVLGILRIVDIALVLLAALIAFNSTSINIDERAREQATMFAFGLPVPTVMVLAVAESVLTGLVGTLLGILAGRVVLTWMITRLLPGIIADVGLVNTLKGTTVLVALALGVLAVGVAPLFSYRRLSHMDIPSTLRVME